MDINGYLILAALAIGLPVLYWAILTWNKPYFEDEQNISRKILKSTREYVVIVLSETALFSVWYRFQTGGISCIMLILIYTILVTMTVLCMTDYWEMIVPNRILLLCSVCCLLEIGFCCIRDTKIIVDMLPSMILGFVFCFLSFGAAYIISRGNMGSGDVKLALVLGAFSTGNYVVRTVFYGCLISALYSIVQLLRKKLNRKDEIPFVPFLYIGLIITCFVG